MPTSFSSAPWDLAEQVAVARTPWAAGGVRQEHVFVAVWRVRSGPVCHPVVRGGKPQAPEGTPAHLSSLRFACLVFKGACTPSNMSPVVYTLCVC